jgi:hypothetical protein
MVVVAGVLLSTPKILPSATTMSNASVGRDFKGSTAPVPIPLPVAVKKTPLVLLEAPIRVKLVLPTSTIL